MPDRPDASICLSLRPDRRLLSGALSAAVGILVMAMPASAMDQAQLRQIAQLAEYIGVDYVEAVRDGEVINDGEYNEMLEFSNLIIEQLGTAGGEPDVISSLQFQARTLQAAIEEMQDVAAVRSASASLRHDLLELMPQLSLPARLQATPDTVDLFEAQCAACHGAAGRGDGPLGAGLEPPPTDFTDRDRAENRSVLGLFDAITNGIDETGMRAFTDLNEHQRWSLAFYAGSLAFQPAPAPGRDDTPRLSALQIVNQSPAQLLATQPAITRSDIAVLRADPSRLFETSSDPLSVTRERLLAAYAANQEGDYRLAKNLAVSAYLDGFELVENSLDTHDKNVRKDLETQLMQLRDVLSRPQDGGELDALMDSTLLQLNEADRLLNDTGLSDGTLFAASLVILLREGLEALLVIIALTTVLIRTGRHDALKYVHIGWIVALVAGGATWVAAQSLISISGANREIMEGVAALLAAVVLFYVGIWMHSKTHAANWQAYIKRNIESRLQSGALWGLTALAFVAVYREVFETVLFYQSLLTQAVASQYSHIVSGFVVAALALLVLAWLLIRYSIKLPLKTFFASTTYLLLALSFVLMGKAISALQEAAVIGISPMPVSFEMDWIGVRSTWQGILAQSTILLIFTVFIFRSRARQPAG